MNKLLLAAAGLATVSALVALAHAGQIPQNGGPVKEPITVPVTPLPQVVPQAAYLPTTDIKSLPTAGQPGALKPGAVPGSVANAFSMQINEPTNSKQGQAAEYLARNFDEADINKDIAVHPGLGDFMISIITYKGNDAPLEARKMVFELRSNPRYKLPAYVMTKGAEEAKAEQQRMRQEMADMEKTYSGLGMPTETGRVKFTRYELECTVVVGGYKDMETGRRACEQIKKLEMPDPARVKLYTQPTFDKQGRYQSDKDVLVNPLKTCMVGRNPSKTAAHTAGWSAEDLAGMKELNRDEPYNLLKSPKPYTLAVKQYALNMQIVTAGNDTSLFGKSPAPQASSRDDTVATKAEVLAELLRKKHKVEAYVLHTTHCSYVTVGSYDAPDDPRIASDRQWLPQLNQKLDPMMLYPALRLVPNPVVMQVPR